MIGKGKKAKNIKWPLILLGIATAIILGVGVWILAGKKNSSQPEESIYSITNESKLAFHRYVNFLLENENSTAKPELPNFLANDYSLLHPMAMSAEQVKLDNPESAQAYFSNLNSMYEEFSRVFFPQMDETDNIAEEYSHNAISDYFFEASKGSYFGLGQIFSLYVQNGEDYVRSIVEDALMSESDNETVKSLLEARKKQIDLYIDAAYRSEQAGCIIDDSLDSNCARPIFEAFGNENIELTSLIDKLETELRAKAMATLEGIYYELYPDEIMIEEGKSK